MDLFYLVRKAAAAIVQPSTFLIFAFALATFLALFIWRESKWLRRAALGSGAALLILAFTPVSSWMFASLERRYSAFDPNSLASPPDVIVVLGGVSGRVVVGEQTHTDLKDGVDRIRHAAFLARTFPSARIILSGGADKGMTPEAQIMAEVLEEFGVARARMLLETRSRTTMDNARFVHDLIPDHQKALLVTSAIHMPRAMAIFKDQGFDVIAAPTDWQSSDEQVFSFGSAAAGLAKADAAVHEYLGLLAYKW